MGDVGALVNLQNPDSLKNVGKLLTQPRGEIRIVLVFIPSGVKHFSQFER